MRIGIDGATWGNRRGYGRFTRELAAALAARQDGHHYTLFMDRFTPQAGVPGNVSVQVVATGRAPVQAASADGYRSPGDMWAFSRAMAQAPLDVLFFPSVYSFVPVLRRMPVLVCIHDVIPERFPHLVFKNRRARLFWMLKTRLAAHQAGLVLTVSDHAKRGLQALYGLPAEKIRTTTEAPSPLFRPLVERDVLAAMLDRLGLPPSSPLVLYFGGLSPHKNIALLVSAFAELVQAPNMADVRLVICGDYEREVFFSAYPALQAQVQSLAAGRVFFTGYVDDETAVQLMNAASVCVMPSLDEGFGLPGIEAAACGTPLIATANSAMPQLLGDAALYVDPRDQVALQAALQRVLGDEELRRTMSRRSLERVRSLSWTEAARRVAAVFDELAPSGAAQPQAAVRA